LQIRASTKLSQLSLVTQLFRNERTACREAATGAGDGSEKLTLFAGFVRAEMHSVLSNIESLLYFEYFRIPQGIDGITGVRKNQEAGFQSGAMTGLDNLDSLLAKLLKYIKAKANVSGGECSLSVVHEEEP